MTVPSPCTLVCSIDIETGWCFGCGRTGSEIAAWGLASDREKRIIAAELPDRLARVQRKPRRVTKRRRLREGGEAAT